MCFVSKHVLRVALAAVSYCVLLHLYDCFVLLSLHYSEKNMFYTNYLCLQFTRVRCNLIAIMDTWHSTWSDVINRIMPPGSEERVL